MEAIAAASKKINKGKFGYRANKNNMREIDSAYNKTRLKSKDLQATDTKQILFTKKVRYSWGVFM